MSNLLSWGSMEMLTLGQKGSSMGENSEEKKNTLVGKDERETYAIVSSD